ncbi:AraC-type DNA-binding protein [bacterium A37T11]|nr:AraC-type DNA-binding protein [bacterium A37T11]
MYEFYPSSLVAVLEPTALKTSFCSHPLPYAAGQLYKMSHGQLLTQSFRGSAFQLGTLCTQSMEPLMLNIHFLQDAVYLIYLYHGSLTLKLEQRTLITVPENRLFVSAIADGTYAATIAAPGTSLLIAAMDPTWHAQAKTQLPNLHHLFEKLTAGTLLADALPMVRPDADMLFFSSKLQHCPAEISSLLNSKLENYLHKLYLAYDRFLQKHHSDALELWRYVHAHYLDFDAFKEDPIRQETWMNLKAANRHYVKAFGATLQQHALHLRMGQGYQNLYRNGETVAKTSYTLHYRAPEIFTRAFHDFFGINPSELLEKRKHAPKTDTDDQKNPDKPS